MGKGLKSRITSRILFFYEGQEGNIEAEVLSRHLVEHGNVDENLKERIT